MERIKNPILSYFADYIEKETGIMYGEDNAYQLENRLVEVCRAVDVPSLESLLKLAQEGGLHSMKKQFILDIATNNETSFFRDPKIFKAFEKHILPEVIKLNNVGPLRIWSVASSFGQEPYSLALILQQQQELGIPLVNAEILTTDISHRAIERVKMGLYSHLEVQRGLPANLMIKYFDKQEDDHWKLKEIIKNRVQTKHVNLLNISGVYGHFHVIFCRNVLIYQNEAKKKEIVAKLATFIPTGGFFVLGAAESMFGISDAFEQVSYESALFYRKK